MALFVRYLLGRLGADRPILGIVYQNTVCAGENQGGNPIGKALVVEKYAMYVYMNIDAFGVSDPGALEN